MCYISGVWGEIKSLRMGSLRAYMKGIRSVEAVEEISVAFLNHDVIWTI